MELRIVSLLPSATEIVYALGLGGRLVGRSHECDHPPDVTRLPPLTATGLDRRRDSATIDQQVRDIVERGLSVYRVDGGRLRALEPDAIVTQTQCEVCAVTEDELAAAVADWLDRKPRLVSQRATALSGLWDDVRRFGDALGRPRQAATLVATLQGRVAAIVKDVRRRRAPRRRVACIEWLDPLMAAGNWVPELVALAG
ncbi:MAG: ABC transporter substrate-binding protein, partial [Alphaproteobacteria bacterium]